MTRITVLFSAMFFSSILSQSVFAEPATDSLEIYFLDVGQGDAMILHQPGICAVLIDAGPLINGHRVAAKLQELEISELGLVIITHPHLDHFGGLFDLHSRFGFKHLHDNGRTNPTREYFQDYQKIRQQQPYTTVSKGDRLSCGDINFEVLYPPETLPSGQDLNATSLVMMISYNNFRLLQMGDLAGDAEHAMLDENQELDADVIKIAHHGAADATSEDLLDKVRPDLAIISTSEDNWIDAPSQVVLDRLKKRGISYFRTDEHKTIKLVVNKNGEFSPFHGAADDSREQ